MYREVSLAAFMPIVGPSDLSTMGILITVNVKAFLCHALDQGWKIGVVVTVQIFIAHRNIVACSLRKPQSSLLLLTIRITFCYLHALFCVQSLQGFLLRSVRPPPSLSSAPCTYLWKPQVQVAVLTKWGFLLAGRLLWAFARPL